MPCVRNQLSDLVEFLSAFGRPLDLADTVFAMVEGYIDESKGQDDWFSLACVLARRLQWVFFSGSWETQLRRLNVKLRKQGRRPISRFHATDLWSLEDEFKGWSPDERTALVRDMRETLEGLDPGIHVVSVSVKLSDLADVFQLKSPVQKQRAAYALLLRYVLMQIADDIGERPGDDYRRIVLFHDHNEKYHDAMQRTFWQVKSDPSFPEGRHFTTLTPATWQDCTPLQAADYFVYENRRNIENKVRGRPLGPNLMAILEMQNFGGSSRFATREYLEIIKGLTGIEWLQKV